MNVGGISTNYSAAYDAEKAQKAGVNGEFSKKMVEAAQAGGTAATVAAHGSDDESGDVAVFRVLYTNSGIKYTVYKTQNFSPENPIYKVKIWDSEENMTERLIDASKVNPRNSDTFEMEVYAAYLMETGKGSFEDTVNRVSMAKSGANSSTVWNYTQKVNWVEAVHNVMQSVYNYGNLKGYMEWKKFLSFLE